MARIPSPLTLAQRVECAHDRVLQLERRLARITDVEMPTALDDLARIEAQVIGKAPGWEQATLTGRIERNPYIPAPTPHNEE